MKLNASAIVELNNQIYTLLGKVAEGNVQDALAGISLSGDVCLQIPLRDRALRDGRESKDSAGEACSQGCGISGREAYSKGYGISGREAVREALLALLTEEKGNFHLLHSAAYRTDPENPDKVWGNWSAFSWRRAHPQAPEEAAQIHMQFLRITIGAVKEGDTLFIQDIFLLPFLTMDPWAVAQDGDHGNRPAAAGGAECRRSADDNTAAGEAAADNTAVGGAECRNTAAGGLQMDPEDYIRIRNCAGMFTAYGYKYWENAFADPARVRLALPGIPGGYAQGEEAVRQAFAQWKEADERAGFVLHKRTLHNPVIAYDGDQEHASVEALSMTWDFEITDENEEQKEGLLCSGGSARTSAGESAGPACTLVRGISRIHITLEKMSGAWRITSVQIDPIVHLQAESCDLSKVMEPMPSRVADRFPEISPDDPGLTAADAFAIESIMPEWTERLKRGDLDTFPDPFMVNETEDIRMSMRVLYQGYQEVMDRCRFLVKGVLGEWYHKGLRFPQFHSANSPVIASDGVHAQAIWDDVAFGNIGNAVNYMKTRPEVIEYFPGLGQYTPSFVRSGDEWKLYYLADRSVYLPPMPAWTLHTNTSYGWCTQQVTEEWPLPFDIS